MTSSQPNVHPLASKQHQLPSSPPSSGGASDGTPVSEMLTGRSTNAMTSATTTEGKASSVPSAPNARWFDGVQDVLNGQPAWPASNEKALTAPFDYLIDNPGHGVRSQLIVTFDHWLKVPQEKLRRIDRVVSMAHTSSLMIDDIEDGSELRRGRPSAHVVYGTPMTINAANYVYFLFFQEMIDMVDCVVPGHTPLQTADQVQRMMVEEMINLHRGQGMDLYWRDNFICPSEAEYVAMCNNKTGGLFRVVLKLMIGQSTTLNSVEEGEALMTLVNLIGLEYQIRDDYMNLRSGDYTQNKGYCEDLSEGKFSFPVLHALTASKALDAGTAIPPHGVNGIVANAKRCVATTAAAAAAAHKQHDGSDSEGEEELQTYDSVQSTLESASDVLAVEAERRNLIRNRSNTLATECSSVYDSPLPPGTPSEAAHHCFDAQGAIAAPTIQSHADFVGKLRARPRNAHDKRALVEYMERVTDSFTYTCDVLLRIDRLARQELSRMERVLDGGRRNEKLRAYINLLRSGWYGQADCPPIDPVAQQTPSPSVELDLKQAVK